MIKTSDRTACDIDIALGATPCLCGTIDGWHPACYEGKSDDQIAYEYQKVYAELRRKLAKDRRAALRNAMLAASPSSQEEKR